MWLNGQARLAPLLAGEWLAGSARVRLAVGNVGQDLRRLLATDGGIGADAAVVALGRMIGAAVAGALADAVDPNTQDYQSLVMLRAGPNAADIVRAIHAAARAIHVEGRAFRLLPVADIRPARHGAGRTPQCAQNPHVAVARPGSLIHTACLAF